MFETLYYLGKNYLPKSSDNMIMITKDETILTELQTYAPVAEHS